MKLRRNYITACHNLIKLINHVIANKLHYLVFEPLVSIISVAIIILVDYLYGQVDVIKYYHIIHHDDHFVIRQ